MSGVSVLIPAHNEAQNIATLIQRVAAEEFASGPIDDIIVIASGCTDATVVRALSCAEQGLPVRVLVQQKREGKASAINLGLTNARHNNVVLISGDVLPVQGAVGALLDALSDSAVGAAGGRPTPLNDPATFVGFAAHLMWNLHDAISRVATEPKLGEMVAFRRRAAGCDVVAAIPVDSAVDEVAIQALVAEAGLRSQYVAEATVHNWGPATLRDWFRQRRRINAGHLLSARAGYHPQTMSAGRIFRALLTDRSCRHRPHWALAVALIEVAARLTAYFDLMRGRTHTVWDVAESTKRRIERETA